MTAHSKTPQSAAPPTRGGSKRTRNQERLTQPRVDRLRWRKGMPERVMVWDDPAGPHGVRGLGLRLSKGGACRWMVRFTDAAGRRRFEALPEGLTLAQARAQAAAHIQKARAGESTGVRWTVRQLCERYKAEHRSRKSGKLAGDDRNMRATCDLLCEKPDEDHPLRRNWGGRRIDRITADDARGLHHEISDGAPYRANRVRAHIKAMWRWAAARGQIVRDPTLGVEPNKERARNRAALTEPEIKRLLAAADDYGDPWIAAFVRLMLSTGCRPSELLELKWADVDRRRGVLRLWDTKTKDLETIPVGSEAKRVIGALPHVLGSPWVFPSPRDPQKHRGIPRKPWAKILKTAKLANLWRYDLKSTSITLVGDRHGAFAAQSHARHADPRTTARYVREGEAARRAVVEDLGKTLAKLEK